MRRSAFPRGENTARPENVAYRIGRLRSAGIVGGRWLDLGCAEGGYLEALLQAGASEVVGADVESARVEKAALDLADNERVRLVWIGEDELPFEKDEFDGCLLNEVLEHVLSDVATLGEVFRVLRPGGCVAVMSPNRCFPLEGHGAHLGRLEARFPFPLVHWLPRRLGGRFMSARTYSPGELAKLIEGAGFKLMTVAYVLPVFERWPALPPSLLPAYRRAIPFLQGAPFLRTFVSVSTLVIGRKPVPAPEGVG